MNPKSKQGDKNLKTYLKAPTWEQIDAFRNGLGVTMAQFERFYGIPARTLPRIKYGYIELPAKFWHIIYEHIKPAYGSGYLQNEDYLSPYLKKRKRKAKLPPPPPPPADNTLINRFG